MKVDVAVMLLFGRDPSEIFIVWLATPIEAFHNFLLLQVNEKGWENLLANFYIITIYNQGWRQKFTL